MKRQFLFLGAAASVLLAVGIYGSSESWRAWILFSPLRASLVFRDGIPPSPSSEADPRRRSESLGPSVVVSRSEVDFGLVPVGERSQEISFTITNGGSVPLELKQIRSRTEAVLVARTPNLPARIGSGVRVMVSLIFAPYELGSLTDVVEIQTNAGNEPVAISIRGRAIESPADAVLAKAPMRQERGEKSLTRNVRRPRATKVARRMKADVPPGGSKPQGVSAYSMLVSDVSIRVFPSLDPPIASWQDLKSSLTSVPYVTLAVREGSSGQTVRCEWELAHPTGRPITYSVFYETTNGRVLLASGLRSQSLEVSLPSVSMITGRIIVQATDGTFTCEDSVVVSASGETHTNSAVSGSKLRDEI